MFRKLRKALRNTGFGNALVWLINQAQLLNSSSSFYWKVYDMLVIARFRRRVSAGAVAEGRLPSDLAVQSLEKFKSASRMPFRFEDHAAGYMYSPDKAHEQVARGKFEWVVLTGETLRCVSSLWAHIRPIAENVLGASLDVVNTKVQWMSPGVGRTGSNAWHTDGFPHQFYKILVYLTPTPEGSGGTEVRWPDGRVETVGGRMGDWVLFNPNTLEHRGTSCVSQERITVELTVVRRLKSDMGLHFGGTNSAYPLYPWTRMPLLA